MEIFFTRFSHLTENIFDKLDNKSLTKCRFEAKTGRSLLTIKNLFMSEKFRQLLRNLMKLEILGRDFSIKVQLK